jgi:hypothetical protein
MSQTITVHKLDHQGQPMWQYTGSILQRDPSRIILEAYFNRDDRATEYHTFKRGDRMVEWFFSDRWFNIFELHHYEDDRLEGWYCNITRPARFEDDVLYADDLALDVMVSPSGNSQILDRDEFEALDIDMTTRQNAENALRELLQLIEDRWGPFASIQ